jgi:diguanylate cyclase (GGDEF)-like protein
MSLSQYIEKQPKWLTLGEGVILILLLGWMDYYTGREVSFSIFYLAPISYTAWFVNRRAGLGAAVLAAAAWFLADLMAGYDYSRSWIPFWNAGVRLGFFGVVVIILARLKRSYEEEKLMARTDPLTGALNSRAFYDLARMELSRARRNHGSVTLAYLDLDNFKSINDRNGHLAGDDLLRAVAEKIRNCVRSYDIVARMGGDEFAVLFPGSGPEFAEKVRSRLEQLLADTARENGVAVTFSIGVAAACDPAEAVEDLVSKADRLMYQAKAEGKNRIKYEFCET